MRPTTTEIDGMLSSAREGHIRDGKVDPEFGCDMHDLGGCRIEHYKAPICLLYICSSYSKRLEDEFNILYGPRAVHEHLDEILLSCKDLEFTHSWIALIEHATKRILDHAQNKHYTTSINLSV